MELILICGPQAVGKMTVGLELEKKIEANLLFNHQTIDLFARFLNYTPQTFALSDAVRTDLFQAFVKNEETNATRGIIFTVVINFGSESDWAVVKKWVSIFTEAKAAVYMVELEADINERVKRNVLEDRLAAKPSKRNVAFSQKELMTSYERHRLNSNEGEVKTHLPLAKYLRLNTTHLTALESVEMIVEWLKKEGYASFK